MLKTVCVISRACSICPIYGLLSSYEPKAKGQEKARTASRAGAYTRFSARLRIWPVRYSSTFLSMKGLSTRNPDSRRRKGEYSMNRFDFHVRIRKKEEKASKVVVL